MKTRFFSTMILLFAVVTIAGATNFRTENSSVASIHEITTDFVITNSIATFDSEMMQEWIDNVNEWEQEGQNNDLTNEAVILEDWISNMDNWEQEGKNAIAENVNVKSSILDEWIAGTENWEQR